MLRSHSFTCPLFTFFLPLFSLSPPPSTPDWDQPLVHAEYKTMFKHDESLLVEELKNLPSSAAARKINDMVKRIRLVKVRREADFCVPLSSFLLVSSFLLLLLIFPSS